MGSFPPLTRLKALITGGNPIRIISYKSYKSAKKSPYPAVAGLPNKDYYITFVTKMQVFI